MLSLYTGTPGSGKSYHGIELGLQFVKKKGYVIANFPITPPKRYLTKFHQRKWEDMLSRWLFMEEITIDYLMALSIEKGWFGKESQCLVLIDEAGIMFNSRDWQSEKGTRNSWIKFFSQHRKFGYDFVLTTQSDRMIDKQIRGLVEYEVKHRKMNNSRMFSFLSYFRFTVFMYIYKWYGTRLKAKMQLSVFKKWVAARYDSMRVFNLEDLIESMKKVYEGKIIPSAVASQIAIWEEEIIQKIEEEKEQREKDLADSKNAMSYQEDKTNLEIARNVTETNETHADNLHG